MHHRRRMHRSFLKSQKSQIKQIEQIDRSKQIATLCRRRDFAVSLSLWPSLTHLDSRLCRLRKLSGLWSFRDLARRMVRYEEIAVSNQNVWEPKADQIRQGECGTEVDLGFDLKLPPFLEARMQLFNCMCSLFALLNNACQIFQTEDKEDASTRR